MKPVIAIPKLGPGLLRIFFRYQYEAALAAAGARIRWIGPENIGDVLGCDGLLIPGGDDVDPKLYGREKGPLCGKQNPLRDRLDPALLKVFLPTGKPILGICRGMQMLNVHLGGTLHQDIKGVQAVCHQSAGYARQGTHLVEISQGTLLHSIVGKEQLTVNTLHHQAADTLGHGLTVSARSTDGIVEAVELADHPFCMGVQWHPEMLAKKSPDHHRCIVAFVKACQ